jgi:hypothetical protein
MGKWLYALALSSALVLVIKLPSANAQGGYPIADKAADKVISHFQESSCEQLAAKKMQPAPTEHDNMKQRAVQLLRNDPNMREYFLNKVAGPIANKLFECGMIP